jgi:transposase
MAYSRDFVERAVMYYVAGHTAAEVKEVFGIARSTLYDWIARAEAGYPKSPKRTFERKINLATLQQALEEKPDSELSDLAKLFDCTLQAIFYALKRMGYTQKKRRLHTRKSQKKHAQNIRMN